MNASALTGIAAVAATVTLVLAGCGSTTRTVPGSPVAAPGAAAGSTEPRNAPRSEEPAGQHETIASYIVDNDIQETQLKPGDPGAPFIDIPIPDGWQDAGDQAAEYYGAIVYTGPEAAEHIPSVVALLSRLTGNVDPQRIIDLAPGEVLNLPGYQGWNETADTLDGYPAYVIAGTWVQDGVTKLVAQKTVVIPGPDGVYVLQFNADAAEDQMDLISVATDAIDAEATITF